MTRAVQLRPADAQFLHNLGAVLAANGHPAQAVEMIQRALSIKYDFAEAHGNIGNALTALGRSADAKASFRRAIKLRPDYPEAHYNLAAIELASGDTTQAINSLQIANGLRPNWADALNNLGNALRTAGRLKEAVIVFRKAIAARGDFAEAYSNLSNALGSIGEWDEAVACGRAAVALKPDSADLLGNFGGALRGQGNVDEAMDALKRAIEIRPNCPEAIGMLALVMKDRGELDASVELFRKALSLKPDSQAAGTLLWTLYYLSEATPESLWLEHRAWNDTYAAPFASHIWPHQNLRDPERKLRIGYCSGDLNSSPIGRFIWPILRNFKRDCFETFCYSDTRRCDAKSDQIRSVSVWRDVDSISDAQLGDQIREDGIDILVDLAMHTGRSRMLMFARKPAPVQITYLIYLGTTGLATMDYRFTDRFTRDEAGDAPFYSERALELPRTYWCYDPPIEAGPVGRCPAASNGLITFGSLNGFGKVTAVSISMWCEILRRVPTARLLLHCQPGSHRDGLLKTFESQGVVSRRAEFIGRLSMSDYFRCYDRIDIALDSFPYPGGTTTCDALWMGVPVVSRVGRTAASRGGRSILSNIGLPELATDSAEAYISKAVSLADNPPYLSDLRRSLRGLMEASPLLDAPAQARDFEAAYRNVWRGFCEGVSESRQRVSSVNEMQ